MIVVDENPVGGRALESAARRIRDAAIGALGVAIERLDIPERSHWRRRRVESIPFATLFCEDCDVSVCGG